MHTPSPCTDSILGHDCEPEAAHSDPDTAGNARLAQAGTSQKLAKELSFFPSCHVKERALILATFSPFVNPVPISKEDGGYTYCKTQSPSGFDKKTFTRHCKR